MQVVIMGCSRTGAELAIMLDAAGHEVTVLDMDRGAFRLLPRTFRGRAVIGNGIDEDVLRSAGLAQADAFAAVTQDENLNIMAAQIAKHRFHVARVACRIHDPEREQLFSSLGLRTISPPRVNAQIVREMLEEQGPFAQQGRAAGS